jgi:hypothetical protein
VCNQIKQTDVTILVTLIRGGVPMAHVLRKIWGVMTILQLPWGPVLAYVDVGQTVSKCVEPTFVTRQQANVYNNAVTNWWLSSSQMNAVPAKEAVTVARRRFATSPKLLEMCLVCAYNSARQKQPCVMGSVWRALLFAIRHLLTHAKCDAKLVLRWTRVLAARHKQENFHHHLQDSHSSKFSLLLKAVHKSPQFAALSPAVGRRFPRCDAGMANANLSSEIANVHQDREGTATAACARRPN